MNKKKIIASAALTTCLCASLIAGATYALFTSEDTVNIAVTSGKVEVVATADKDSLQLSSTLGTNLSETRVEIVDEGLKLNNIVPGDVVTFNIVVENFSTVTVKYQTVIDVAEDNGLFSGLQITVGKTTVTGKALYSKWETLEPATGDSKVVETIPVTITLPESAVNKYQGTDCTISYIVKAVQGNAQTEDVDYNVNDDEGFVDKGNKQYEISNVNGLFYFADLFNANNEKNDRSFDDATVKLTDNIDLAGYIWTPIDDVQGLNFVFDGNGKTISNLNAGHTELDRSGFFGNGSGATIENLTLENVTVRGSQAGAFAGLAGGTDLKNCTLVGPVNVSYEDFKDTAYSEDASALGVLVGVITEDGFRGDQNTVRGDVTVNLQGMSTVLNNRTEQLLFGFYTNSANGHYTLKDTHTSDANITVFNETDTLISTKEELFAFADKVNNGDKFSGKTVYLMADIDLANETWTPIGNITNPFQGTFDGGNHTISNLACQSDNQYIGLFGDANGDAILQNFTLKNVNVKGQAQVGAVAGSAYTVQVISNVHVTGLVKIEGNYKVGGITGESYGKIENCSVKATAGSYVKGVYLDGVDNCEGDNVGGIIGYTGEHGAFGTALDRIINCSVENLDVFGTRKIGGIVGYANYGVKVDGCSFSNGNITITATEEYAKKNKTFAGGIVGEYCDNGSGYATITNNSVENTVIAGADGLIGEIVGGTRGTNTNVVIKDNTSTDVTFDKK